MGEGIRRIRVLIADDHAIVRRGIRSTLEREPDFEVVAECADGREAVEAALRLKPDVLVLDLRMPQLTGLEATREIRQSWPEAQTLIVTGDVTAPDVLELAREGVPGFMMKTAQPAEMVFALRAVAQRRPYFCSSALTILLEQLRGAGPDADPITHELSPREIEVVKLLAEGLNNREIGEVLGLSPKTIEAHRANILRKMGAHSTVQVVRRAIRARLIDP